MSLWTEGQRYSLFVSTVDRQPWVDAQSHAGLSVLRLHCCLTAAEVWAADRASCQSAEGKHQAHCYDYHLNPGAGVSEATSRSCVIMSACICGTMHMDLSKIVALNKMVYDICCYASWCFKWHFGDGFYEIKRPSTRLSTPPELNWIFCALIQHKCLQRDRYFYQNISAAPWKIALYLVSLVWLEDTFPFSKKTFLL